MVTTRSLPGAAGASYHTVKRSETQKAIIYPSGGGPDEDADGMSSTEMDFGAEYCFFKIYCPDTNPAAELVMQPYAGGGPIYINGEVVELTTPTSGAFTWIFAPIVGLRKLTLFIPDEVSDEMTFHVTAYEAVES